MRDESCGLTTICRETVDRVTISIAGALAATQMHAIERYLGPEFEGFAGDVFLEMDGVEAMSTRAGAFLAAGRERLASRGRRLVIASASPAVHRALADRRAGNVVQQHVMGVGA